MISRESKVPEDTDDELHFYGNTTLDMILHQVRAKWGNNVRLHTLQFSALHFHARCLTYDLHDPSDWDDYVVVTRVGS